MTTHQVIHTALLSTSSGLALAGIYSKPPRAYIFMGAAVATILALMTIVAVWP